MDDAAESPEQRLLRQLLDPRNRCPGCSKPLLRYSRHCPECGSANQNFDLAEFVKMNNISLEEGLILCDSGQHSLFGEPAEGIAFLPYCEHCGRNMAN